MIKGILVAIKYYGICLPKGKNKGQRYRVIRLVHHGRSGCQPKPPSLLTFSQNVTLSKGYMVTNHKGRNEASCKKSQPLKSTCKLEPLLWSFLWPNYSTERQKLLPTFPLWFTNHQHTPCWVPFAGKAHFCLKRRYCSKSRIAGVFNTSSDNY